MKLPDPTPARAQTMVRDFESHAATIARLSADIARVQNTAAHRVALETSDAFAALLTRPPRRSRAHARQRSPIIAAGTRAPREGSTAYEALVGAVIGIAVTVAGVLVYFYATDLL